MLSIAKDCSTYKRDGCHIRPLSGLHDIWSPIQVTVTFYKLHENDTIASQITANFLHSTIFSMASNLIYVACAISNTSQGGSGGIDDNSDVIR